MHFRELLAAAAELTRAEAKLRDASLELDSDLFIGPPRPVLIVELESTNEAERFEEVALKTLIVIRRFLREADPTFREELLNFSQRAGILQLSNFKDDSSPIAWDCFAWVRTYALFLEERLECFQLLKYDIKTEHLSKPTEVSEKGHTRMRELNSEELLEKLPALQQLLHRLIGCHVIIL